ncbi:MAG: phosphate acetyltransferase [Bacilli bacterium]|nr:phosphate acetyltransferase [Bacilli bacterium]
MSFINEIIQKAKSDKKRIVLPETMDERVLKAAEIIQKEGIADVILIGDKVINEQVTVINPLKYDKTEEFINKLYEMRKEKGLTYEEAKDLILNDYMYFACMLLHEGLADGIVSGACHSTANTLRPALQIIKGSSVVSSFFLMEVPNCEYGLNGTFVFADCGLVQNPNEEELAIIAKESADSFKTLTNNEAYVAMISHSTKGSAKHEFVDKVVNATKIAKEKYTDLKIEGELQVDAAIDREVAKLKCPDSDIAGKANVLVFPNLDAGNSAYKLVQRLAKAGAYGPITQGLNKPVNDLSRGCSIDDIVGAVAITVVQVQNISDKK